jgi:hypothetical protein
MYHISAVPQKLRWLFDGREFDIGVGDEVEIDTGMPLIPQHRGLIYNIGDGTPEQVKVIHNNKWVGVSVAGCNDFADGKKVRLRRRPSSPEHARAIWEWATAAINHPYDAVLANCEQFTDYCYTGRRGESPTLQKWVLGVAVLVLVAVVRQD